MTRPFATLFVQRRRESRWARQQLLVGGLGRCNPHVRLSEPSCRPAESGLGATSMAPGAERREIRYTLLGQKVNTLFTNQAPRRGAHGMDNVSGRPDAVGFCIFLRVSVWENTEPVNWIKDVSVKRHSLCSLDLEDGAVGLSAHVGRLWGEMDSPQIT